METESVGCEPQRGLECCPKCGYSLTGLPVAYTCPECGFVYDQDTLVVRQATGTPLIAVVMGAISCFMAIVNLIVTGLDAAATKEVAGFGTLGISLLVFGIRSLAKPNRAILSQRGVEISGHKPWLGFGRLHLSICWKDVYRIKSLASDVTFVSHDGEPLAKLPGDFFGGSERAKEFLAAATEWHERYGQADQEDV